MLTLVVNTRARLPGRTIRSGIGVFSAAPSRPSVLCDQVVKSFRNGVANSH
jgi:hypothetical protein